MKSELSNRKLEHCELKKNEVKRDVKFQFILNSADSFIDWLLFYSSASFLNITAKSIIQLPVAIVATQSIAAGSNWADTTSPAFCSVQIFILKFHLKSINLRGRQVGGAPVVSRQYPSCLGSFPLKQVSPSQQTPPTGPTLTAQHFVPTRFRYMLKFHLNFKHSYLKSSRLVGFQLISQRNIHPPQNYCHCSKSNHRSRLQQGQRHQPSTW